MNRNVLINSKVKTLYLMHVRQRLGQGSVKFTTKFVALKNLEKEKANNQTTSEVMNNERKEKRFNGYANELDGKIY